jgi:hypothetical protein
MILMKSKNISPGPRPPRKVRSDAKLQRLPQNQQDEIVLFAQHHSLKNTVCWLRETKQIEVTDCTVSRFLALYRTSQRFERNAAAVELALACLKEHDPTLTPEVLHQTGQHFFSGLAMRTEDAEIWNITRQIELKKARLDLDLQRFHDQVRERRAKLKHDLQAAKTGAGINPETIKQIEHELNLM